MKLTKVIDSHTGGEPTRVIIEGGPDLGSGPISERARLLETKHNEFCRSVLCEPRGYDAMVGALIVAPVEENCLTGVIFFNTSQNLGMCGHATVGLLVTLYYLGKISVGNYKIETATRTGKPNAFSYFTQICYFAFIRRISKEKRQQDIKFKFIEKMGIEDFTQMGMDDEGAQQTMAYVDTLRERISKVRDTDKAIKEFKKAETAKLKKLELFMA